MPEMGRPPKYQEAFVDQARKLCILGATDYEVADFFAVDVRTVLRWKHEHEDFCQALKIGKDFCDDRVERSLYNRAVGYTYDAVKIFMPAGHEEPVYAPFTEHVPPETGAAMSWLKNRRKDTWRDKTDIDVTIVDLAAQISDRRKKIIDG